jgi:peptidoglycan/xylan/chitin deacetylase (PgdA/CDA1 family)
MEGLHLDSAPSRRWRTGAPCGRARGFGESHTGPLRISGSPVLKHAALATLTAPGVNRAFRGLMHRRATVFMLHRFSGPDGVGHDVAGLRTWLGRLRAARYPLLDLGELFEALRADRPLRGAVAFTLDDGYLDQAELAGPVFAEFDCPATIFVTTGFLDGRVWFWWDQIAFVFRATRRTSFTVESGHIRVTYALDVDRARAVADYTARLKAMPDVAMRGAVADLARAAEVDLPDTAPPEYAPLSWEGLRSWERRGLRFGPHTVTHPILARADEESSVREIADSWNRLRLEAQRPVPVFCYPNGQEGDFGEREFRTVARLGLLGGVIGIPGFATAREFGTGLGRFMVPPAWSASSRSSGEVERESARLGARSRELAQGGSRRGAAAPPVAPAPRARHGDRPRSEPPGVNVHRCKSLLPDLDRRLVRVRARVHDPRTRWAGRRVPGRGAGGSGGDPAALPHWSADGDPRRRGDRAADDRWGRFARERVVAAGFGLCRQSREGVVLSRAVPRAAPRAHA